MKSLDTYIFETLSTKSGRFNMHTSSYSKLLNLAPHLNAAKYKTQTYRIIKEIVRAYTGSEKNIFIFSEGKSYFKMNYDFAPIIRSAVNNFEDFHLKDSGDSDKIALYYNDGKKDIKVMETGKGSIGRVQTAVQEKSTCAVFNSFVELADDDINKMNDLIYIRNIISDIFSVEVEDMDNSWISSFGKQVKALVSYLASNGLNPADYRLTRYGEKDDVAKAYTNMIRSYADVNKSDKNDRASKDTYDPSDVILYKKDNINDIIKYCKSGRSIDDYIGDNGIKTNYTDKLFLNHICMGVSLKKITKNSGSADLFNVSGKSTVMSVNEFNIIKESPKNITVSCIGNFNFDNLTDDSGNDIDKERNIHITLRTFGYGITAMDVKINETGECSLGKCPVNIWRSMIKCNSKDIKQCTKAFSEFLKTASNNDIMNIIKYAIKEGPHCFSFILLH